MLCLREELQPKARQAGLRVPGLCPRDPQALPRQDSPPVPRLQGQQHGLVSTDSSLSKKCALCDELACDIRIFMHPRLPGSTSPNPRHFGCWVAGWLTGLLF